MLRNLKPLYGEKLGALDGEVGQVKDFYFDDRSWAVRYVVADTGTWLAGRQVLLAPYGFGSLRQAGKLLIVNLSRKQIENSPPIESHKPVSRQYEEEYHRYYGWPAYWADGTEHERPDAHLRSTQAVAGYHLRASDGVIGHVCDFLVGPQTWAICQLVIKIGHRFSGNEVQLPTNQVERISYEESTVFARLNKAAVEGNSGSELAPAGAADARLI